MPCFLFFKLFFSWITKKEEAPDRTKGNLRQNFKDEQSVTYPKPLVGNITHYTCCRICHIPCAFLLLSLTCMILSSVCVSLCLLGESSGSLSLQSTAPAINYPNQLKKPLQLKTVALPARLCQIVQSSMQCICQGTTSYLFLVLASNGAVDHSWSVILSKHPPRFGTHVNLGLAVF